MDWVTTTKPLFLKDEEATTRFGAHLAKLLGAGDTVLLQGQIGAGKTHLARAVIRTLLPTPEHIPSPTFTLVQTYFAHDLEIWHADLYRLGDSSELVELGLDEAFEKGVVLIEWPDRLPDELLPQNALKIDLATEKDGRLAHLSTLGTQWARKVEVLTNE